MVDHTFSYQKGNSSATWDVKDLWKSAESVKSEMYDVQSLLSLVKDKEKHFDKDDYERIEEADQTYPVIVSADATVILDGVHRVFGYAKVGGEMAIKRLKILPEPITFKGNPFSVGGSKFKVPKQSLGTECFSSQPKSFNW